MSSVLQAVEGSRLMRDIAEVARWTKLAGTPTEVESLRYFAAELQTIGFSATLLHHDAYISLPGPARIVVAGQVVAAITHSFSRPSPAEGLTAGIVDIGRGHASDYAGRDLRGRIVLIDGIATPETSKLASAAGAMGQIHVSPHEQRYAMCISPVWGSPTMELRDRLPSTVVATISGPDGRRLREALAVSPVEATLFAEVDTGWRKTPLLVADMASEAGTPDEPFVLLSGHNDTWYFGVMDNGAANATMLEIARVLAPQRARWKRGLRLCFWSGHSQGRYSGSAWYADAHWAELERRCVAHVNVDSTGGMNAVDLSETASMSLLHALAKEAVEEHAGQSYVGKRRGRSGDDSFGGIGVPSMFGPVSEQPKGDSNGRRNLGWWWHTPEDLADKVDEAHLVRDTRVVGHAVWRLVTDEILPIDLQAQLRDLQAQLEPLSAAAAARDLCEPIAVAAARLAATITDTTAALKAGGIAGQAMLNEAIRSACRALVPVDYTSGDRFAHEPALPVPAWPALEPLRRLAREANEADIPFRAVSAMRARNHLLHALQLADAAFAHASQARDQR
ncbi:M28 family peptidase [Roseomonas sp. HJA6]|uniref:M28 family peptidase n=1 Tax=Roseomonas alba TaxID=2846776 RepID=A0ABS7ADR9_9PROT|nr:M28 family peptidase [Neoroseomonas alba]MBW6400450.1 M28 family peptidase [Neoroseomonas alba]